MSDDNPQAELAAWKATRQSYPGWLVPPRDNRARLIRDIEQSLHIGSLAHGLVWEKLADWPAGARLDAWAQLNWRMERALLPLRPEWASKIEAVLEEVPDAPGLRAQWLELAIGLMRHYREFRNDAKFLTWHTRLSLLDADWDQVHHQRAYQLALWHLTRLDDENALAGIQMWKAERGADPYWQARKAGVLAELGKPEEAQTLWDECLRRLQGCGTNAAPFFGTSRESAALTCAHRSWEYRPAEDRERADRLRMLSNIDGWDYWGELSALSRPDLEFRERHENGDTIAFYQLWKPQAGVQCFRLSEELGEPLIVRKGGGRYISGIAGALADSFADLALSSEELAGTSLMRLRHEEFWQKRLDPAHVAGLPDNLLDHIREACENAWRPLEKALTRNDSERSAYLLSGLLRVLRWRLDGDQRRKWFSRLLSLGTRDAVRATKFVARALKEVIEELADDFTPAQVLDVLGEALSFPLPGEVGTNEHFWPDVMALSIPDPIGADLPDGARERIDVLMNRAPADRDALRRLAYLEQAGMLPEEVAQKLAAKVWAAEGLELPDVAPLRPPLFLNLPASAPEHPQNALAEYFLKSPPPNLRGPTGGISFGGPEWFRDLHYVSKPYRRQRAPFVAWKAGQAEALLTYAEAWWQHEGKQLYTDGKDLPFSSGTEARMYWLRFCLARALAPVLGPSSAAGKVRLPQLVDDIAGAGYSMLSVLPLLLRFKVSDDKAAAERLIQGMKSRDQEVVSDALWGVIHWCEFQKDAKLPAVPHRLIEQLLIFLAARAEGKNAADAVGTIEAILDHDLSILSSRAKELLELALDALQARAAYPDTWHQRDGQRYANTVQLRQNAVLLASAAHKAGISNHEAVEYWLEVGRTDPLPIVRQAMKM